ncbi:uncharacterized protein LOC117114520 isoform X2 [Anneissia japonica]|nr:uncharacterized protein LOC117114520 isoform X2 [Anneissia japonica]
MKSMKETIKMAVEKKERLQDATRRCQRIIQNTDEEETVAIELIENHRQNLKVAVDEACDKLITELNIAKKNKVQSVTDQLALINKQEQLITTSELIMKAALKSKKGAILDKKKTDEEENLKDVIRSTTAETIRGVYNIPISFYASEESIQRISTSVGSVVTESNFICLELEGIAQDEAVVGENITILASQHPAIPQVAIVNNFQLILFDGEGNANTLPVAYVNGRFEIKFVPLVATEYTIKLQFSNGEMSESMLKVNVRAREHTVLEIGNVENDKIKFHRPNDVCITSDGLYVVADRFNNRVVICNRLGKIEGEIKAVKWNGKSECRIYPHGVSATSSGGILIADPENKIVFLCNRTGHLQKRFGESLLRFPTSVAVGNDGSVYVIDSKHNALYTFNEEGKILKRIPSADDEILTLMNPRYVCASATGEALVADTGNARILVLDTSGKLLNFIKIEYNDRIGYPNGITVDNEGIIYVSVSQEGENGHLILKYKMTGTLIGHVESDCSRFVRGMCMDSSFPVSVLLVADYTNNCIKGISVESLNGV